jgi:AcrR family transcriptional regulator
MTEFNDKQIEILQVAERLFAEDGFDGTSIRMIAKEAQVNIAMISYYFGSKEKLLEALIVHRISGMKIQLENIFNDDLSTLQKLDNLTDLYISRIHKNRCIYQILHFEVSSKKRGLDMKAFTDIKRENMEIFTRFIEEGQAQGIFKKDVNIALIPATIMGVLINFQMNRTFFEQILNLDTDDAFEKYIQNELTAHIKQTINALLLNEN